MNILHIIRDLSPKTGGPVTAVLGLAVAQARRGHRVRISSTDFDLDQPHVIPKVEIDVFPCLGSGWRYSKEMGKKLDNFIQGADIVHIHTLWEYPTWLAGRLCRKFNTPYIVRPCGMLDPWSLSQKSFKKKLYLKLALRSVFRNASGFHFTSSGELEKSQHWGPRDKGFVVPIGIPEDMYQNLPSSRNFAMKFPVLNGKQFVLFLSRVHPKKQPDLAIQAFAKIHKIFERHALVFAGSGDESYINTLKDLANSLNIKDKVFFIGMLDRSSVRSAFAAADVFVLPSHQENFGIAAVEAMAAGCPVIVSDCIDLAQDIQNAEAGVVCEPKAEIVAMHLERLLADDSLRKTLSQNARDYILNHFTWDKVVKQLDIEYSKITNR